MYHDQLAMAIPGGYAVGAAGQVPFEEPETAAVAFGLERQDTPAVLTFFCESCCLASPGCSCTSGATRYNQRKSPHCSWLTADPAAAWLDQTRTC